MTSNSGLCDGFVRAVGLSGLVVGVLGIGGWGGCAHVFWGGNARDITY